MKKNFSALSQIGFILKFSGQIYSHTDRGLFLWIISLNIVPSLVIVPNLYLDKLFLDTIVTHLRQPDFRWALNNLLVIVASKFLLDTLRTMSNRFSGFYTRKFLMKVRQHTEVLVGTKYATISVPTLEDPSFKDRYQKIERESMDRLVRIAENYIRLPQHIVAILSSLSLFVFTQPLIIAVSLASLIPSIFVDRKYIKKAYDLDAGLSVTHRLRGMYSHFLSRTRSYMELRLLNIHEYLAKKVSDTWDKVIAARLGLDKGRRTAGFFAGLVDSVTAYVLDIVFGIQALMGMISLGSAQAYVRAISIFKLNVTNLTTAVLELYENFLYVTDLVWFLDLENPYFNDKGEKTATHFKKGITFNDVWFKYPGTDNWILRGVSFNIEAKENIAIVGKNGAGKTTLVKLLCGFYLPTRGQIFIDGQDVTLLNKRDYWEKISVLFQEFEGYNITARESIGAGKIAHLDDLDRIRKYAEATGVDSWIQSLPKGYENPLSRDFEGGISPSTGQWQRIGIARALLRDPELLVLDEPTSNVDPEAEEDIFNHILKMGKDKIVIFISHRFSTVRRADSILVLEEGKVIQEGSHEKLMKEKGTYAKLFTLQAKSYR